LLLLSLIMVFVTPGSGRLIQPKARFRRLKDMRMRLMALASVSLTVAGCGAGSHQAAGGQTTATATSSVSAAAAATPSAAPASAGSSPARTPAPGTAAGASPANGACAGPTASYAPGALPGLEFVSATQGWAVGQGKILATTDGGAHWTTQLSGNLNLSSVDFISGHDGWAVGTATLLATTDGGAHWTSLPEPCPVIDSVHFISPTTGFAVAGGRDSGAAIGPQPPGQGGVVLTTSDGGRTWHPLAAPASAQTVCFSDPQHGWLGAAGLLYRTSDGGRDWTVLTSMAGQAGSTGSGYTAGMAVECASDGSAWALRVGPGAAMSQEPHVGYHANQAGATPIFAEQYFQNPGGKPVAQAPGSIAGPFSALSPSAAVFVDSCSACGAGTAPWDVATNSGAMLTREGNVGSITAPQAASFLSPEVGWVAGSETVYLTADTGKSKSQERIVATADGGRTWHVQWAGAWSAQ
jgi:Photosynthesis system II assembly factor YCF48